MIRMLPLLVLALACSAGSSQVREISAEDLLSEPASTLILDVRSPDEFAKAHVPNAINIPHDQLAARIAEIEGSRDTSVVVYCESGRRAGKATAILADAKFSKLRHLTGDMSQWRQRNLPTMTAAREH